MSREIDLDKPLSDDDRQYLLERNRDQDVINNDARFSGEEYADPADASALSEGGDPASGSEDQSGDNYDSLLKEDLQVKLDERGIEFKASDNKATLIELLREDDRKSDTAE